MYIVNLRCDYSTLINMIENAKAAGKGNAPLEVLDSWLEDAVDSATIFENRERIIKAVYPGYTYAVDMAPDYE